MMMRAGEPCLHGLHSTDSPGSGELKIDNEVNMLDILVCNERTFFFSVKYIYILSRVSQFNQVQGCHSTTIMVSLYLVHKAQFTQHVDVTR